MEEKRWLVVHPNVDLNSAIRLFSDKWAAEWSLFCMLDRTLKYQLDPGLDHAKRIVRAFLKDQKIGSIQECKLVLVKESEGE